MEILNFSANKKINQEAEELSFKYPTSVVQI